MGGTLLFLVDRRGQALTLEQRSAVQAAFRWAVKDQPRLDGALLASWAEQVGASMAEKASTIESPRRYAFAALQGKIREHFRAGGLRELTVGISEDLEEWVGLDAETARHMEREVLFQQLQTKLNDRDRHILVLLQQDVTSPADVASALGLSYNAAAKAVQRVKERVRGLVTSPSTHLDSQADDD